MPETDSLTVRIEADVSGLRRGLREAEQLVAQSSRSMVKSLAGVEKSLRKIGAMSAALPPAPGGPERQITFDDRIQGALTGFGVASAAMAFSGPVTISIAAASTIGGTTMGAFIPDAQALLSKALTEPTVGERLTEIENRIAQLQSMQGIRTGMEFGDSIREGDLEERIRRLQQERSDLLRQLDRQRQIRDKSDLGEVGLINGSVGANRLTGDAGDDVLRLTGEIEGLGATYEDLSSKTSDLTERQRMLDTATRDLGFTFASAFEDAVVEGRRLSAVLEGLERDILRILTRKLVTEPLAGALTGVIGTGLGAFAGEFHGGGKVGSTAVSSRVVPAVLFEGAPRFAGGGLVGRVPRLAPGEVPAILHRGEVVRTPAQEAALRRSAGAAGDTHIVVNIQTPDPRAFNESRGQIQAMFADAVRAGRRFR